jgi:enoyl-[acyl-carrier-protein] reductase (NADH)
VRLGPLEEGGMGGDVSLRAGLRALTADGGLVTAEEAAAAVLFLLSDRASGITGQTLVVDHGFGLAY